MKRSLLLALAVIAAGLVAQQPAHAQYGGAGDIIPGGTPTEEPKKEPYVPETEQEPDKNARKDETCPGIAVLSDADHSTIFDGKGRDVTNIVYQANLSPGQVDCDHKKDRQINIDVTADISVTLGLAAEGQEIEVPYFIALIDPEDMVVTKEEGRAVVKVERGNRTGMVKVESPTIKLVLEPQTIGADLQVMVGLQLSRDELDYNRSGR